MRLVRGVASGEWRGCRFFIHVGTTCAVFGGGTQHGRYYAPGIELLTPDVLLSVRPFRWLHVSRRKYWKR